jgi:hypothetical protein
MEFGVDLPYGAPVGIIHGKTSSAISGHPDIPCFLLLDDPANELLLPAGLGTGRLGQTQLGKKAAYYFVSALWF